MSQCLSYPPNLDKLLGIVDRSIVQGADAVKTVPLKVKVGKLTPLGTPPTAANRQQYRFNRDGVCESASPPKRIGPLDTPLSTVSAV